MESFKDKIALVTGGVSSLGRAICEELLKYRIKVSICDLDSDAGELYVKDLEETFGKGRVLFCHCDVTDYIQFEESFHTTIAAFGGLDIVINNAEIMNDKFWELEVDVNLNGVIRGTLLAQQFMGKDKGGKGGIVVNIGSSASFRPQLSTPIYTATKHAILGLTRSCGDLYHFNLSDLKIFAYCLGPLVEENATHSYRFKSPAHERARKIDMSGVEYQKSEYVAKELIPLLKTANSGSIWFVENGKPAKEIPYSGYSY